LQAYGGQAAITDWWDTHPLESPNGGRESFCADAPLSGPYTLRPDPASETRDRQLIAVSLHYAGHKLRFYDLHAWVIMSNHVHLLVTPKIPPKGFLQSLKGYTPRKANRTERENRSGKRRRSSTGYAMRRRSKGSADTLKRIQCEQELPTIPRNSAGSSTYAGKKADIAG
jgi:hypothetical protein